MWCVAQCAWPAGSFVGNLNGGLVSEYAAWLGAMQSSSPCTLFLFYSKTTSSYSFPLNRPTMQSSSPCALSLPNDTLTTCTALQSDLLYELNGVPVYNTTLYRRCRRRCALRTTRQTRVRTMPAPTGNRPMRGAPPPRRPHHRRRCCRAALCASWTKSWCAPALACAPAHRGPSFFCPGGSPRRSCDGVLVMGYDGILVMGYDGILIMGYDGIPVMDYDGIFITGCGTTVASVIGADHRRCRSRAVCDLDDELVCVHLHLFRRLCPYRFVFLPRVD